MTSIKLACRALVAALLVVVSAPQVQAQNTFSFVSSTGSDGNPCTAASPCATLSQALSTTISGGQISCLDATAITELNFQPTSVPSFTIDCTGVVATSTVGTTGAMLQLANSDQVVKIRNLTFNGQTSGGGGAIEVSGSGTLIIENCVFENFANGTALSVDQSSGAVNLVVINSRISNNAAGVLIEPFVIEGGVSVKPKVKATFDRVTITQNTGGGIKINSSAAPVTVDITASEITDNGGNGLNAVSQAGGAAAMFNIGHSVIAQNGDAGVQANGANAAALIDTTLLDSNAAGALAAIGGGRILTYGNNRIVGSAGTGFTGPAALQ
jgi:hypothetical protein